MKKIFPYLAFGAALAVAVGAPVRSSHAESLYEAVQAAVLGHPAVTAAREAQGASVQGVREQRSAYFPELSATAQGGRIYGDNSTSRGLNVTRGAGYSGLWEGNASLTQRVYDFGETGNKVDAARARQDAAASIATGTQEGVALRAAQAYIALLRAGELKAGAAANLEAIKSYRQRIKAQVEEGGADEAELNRASDFLLLAQNAATQFEGDYQQAQADYAEATGAAPKATLKRPGLPAALPRNVDAAIDAANAGHPQIQAAKAAVIAGDHDIRAESTMYLPKFSTQLSYMERDQEDIIGGEATDARAVMKMDWNYSTGGAQHARVERASYLKAQAKAQLDEAYRRIERDVRVAWAALDVVRQQQKTQSERRAATAAVVDTYKTQYEGGSRTLIELMQAESQAFDAAIAYSNADYGILNATYTLLASMGGLVSALEPGANTAQAGHDEAAQP